MPSFDVVSRVDLQEVDNAVNQAIKEIQNRYDFRGSKNTFEWDKKSAIVIEAADKMKLRAMTDILNEKAAKRGVGIKSLDYKDPENATGGSFRQKIELKQGISTDDGKKIVKWIKDLGLKKVQAQIQQDQVRVSAPKKDDLQEVIKMLRANTEFELQYVNFKD